MNLFSTELILRMQSIHAPALQAVMVAVTGLGYEPYFMAILLIVYWCIDSRKGKKLMLFFALSASVNYLAKIFFHLPRPYQVDRHVRGIKAEPSFGFPSGHIQGNTFIWGSLTALFRSTLIGISGACIIILVALNRLYVGAHFPGDVLGGFLFGSGLVLLLILLNPLMDDQDYGLKPWIWLVAGGSAPLLCLLAPDHTTASSSGALLGFAGGGWMEQKYIRFTVDGSILQRVLRGAVGAAAAILIRAGMENSLPALVQQSIPPTWLVFTVYALMAWLLVFLLPAVFILLHLATRRSDPPSAADFQSGSIA